MNRLKDQQRDNKIRKDQDYRQEMKEAEQYWKKLEHD